MIYVQYPEEDLYLKYPGQTNTQPVKLCLDLGRRTLQLYIEESIGPTTSHRAFHRVDLEWTVLPLTKDAATSFLDEVADLADKICDHSKIEWNGSNYVGLIDEAQVYLDEMETLIEEKMRYWGPEEIVSEWDAHHYFSACTEDDLGITETTTDEEIETIAKELIEEAPNNVKLVGVEDYLCLLRTCLRVEDEDE